MPPRKRVTRASKAAADKAAGKGGKQTSISDFFKQSPKKQPKSTTANESVTRKRPLSQPSTTVAVAKESHRPPSARTPEPVPIPLSEKMKQSVSATDGMDVDTAPAMNVSEDAERQLTQEELDVHDQLQSLECSTEAPVYESLRQDPSPEKRPRTERAFAFASGANQAEDRENTSMPKDVRTPETDGDALNKQDESDSDSEAEFLREVVPLRRSSRLTKEVERFDPDESEKPLLGGSGVWGMLNRSAKDAARFVNQAVKEMNRRKDTEGELEEMRRELDNGVAVADEDDEMFAGFAATEEKLEKGRLEAYDKYSKPLLLFVQRMKMKKMEERWLDASHDRPRLQVLLLQAISVGRGFDAALKMFVSYAKIATAGGAVRPSGTAAKMLYHLAVYDDEGFEAGREGRSMTIEALKYMFEMEFDGFKHVVEIPSLVNTLENYGALLGDDPREVLEANIADEASGLDAQIPADQGLVHDDENTREPVDLSDDFRKAVRNCRRACQIASMQISTGVSVTRAMGLPKGKHGSEELLHALGICARLLLCPFGMRLYREVQEIIEQLLELVDKDQWNAFRLRAAAYILSFTTRLELHIELVTNLISLKTQRSRYLAFDIGFLSLRQWCKGPGAAPQPQMYEFAFEPRSTDNDLSRISFCLRDVVELLKQVPEMGKDTDTVWAALLSKLLKFLLCEPRVLSKRQPTDLGAAAQQISKMRTCTHRMAFEVAAQEMRIELDTLTKVIRDYSGMSKDARAEVMPNAKAQLKQTSLFKALSNS